MYASKLFRASALSRAAFSTLSQAVSAALRETIVKALQPAMRSGELPGCLGLSFIERGKVACDCVTTQLVPHSGAGSPDKGSTSSRTLLMRFSTTILQTLSGLGAVALVALEVELNFKSVRG
jgi:hypothetical protein